MMPEPVGMSDAARLRDAVISILDALPEWSGRVKARRLIPTAKHDFPVILVHVSSERFDAYGSGTAGRPDYTVSTDVTVAIAMNAASDADIDERLDEATDRILNAIMTDADFMASIEGVTRITREVDMPKVAETVLGVATLVYTIQNSAAFEPVIVDIYSGGRATHATPPGTTPSGFTFDVDTGV